MIRGILFGFTAFVLAMPVVGCGGPSEKDKNPNPGLEFSKEGPPKRSGGVPATTPKGGK